MKNLPARCWIEIDGSALKKNLQFLRARIEPGTKIVAIVKANGFGHGMLPVARFLLSHGVEALGVAHIHEARELRVEGIRVPILVLSAALPSEYPEIIACQAWPILSTLEEAKALNRAAKKLQTVAEAHFKVDTGMGRMGLWQDEAIETLQGILQLPNVRILAVATHFSQAEDNRDFTLGQLEEFAEFHSHFPALPFHVSNSAASCLQLVRGGLLVRVGLAIYGIPPLEQFRKDLFPALTWKSRITLIRHLPAGRTISYGATYTLPKPQTLATVAVGYGDGYPRAVSNRGEVLIGGRRCPIRGRVTMDQLIVDISTVPEAQVEDEVVLIGRQDDEEITIDELAATAQTITYDIATGLLPRVPRLYKKWK